MSCNTEQDVRIITKYSTISGVEPTIPLSADHTDGTWLPTDIYVSEIFINSADNLVWTRTDSGIIPLAGSFSATFSFTGDFVPTSGGTFSGCVYIPCLTVGSASIEDLIVGTVNAGYVIGTFSGDGSGLTGINVNWDGGTVSNPVYFTNTVDFTNTINLNGPVVGNLDLTGDVEISGGVSASIFYGDGSGLTNLPTGTYSDIYTTAASLSGNNIVFDRNDLIQYSVDLTPILATQGVASITWNSSLNALDLTLLSGDVVSTVIDGFDTLTALTSVTAPEFYGGVFYGEFVGTFSGAPDIYSTTMSLVGTELIIERNDGITFSTDLSSLAGGATPSLSEVLLVGNTTDGSNIVLGTDKITDGFGDLFSIYKSEGQWNIEANSTDREGRFILRDGVADTQIYNRTYTGVDTFTQGRLLLDSGQLSLAASSVVSGVDGPDAVLGLIGTDYPMINISTTDVDGNLANIHLEGNLIQVYGFDNIGSGFRGMEYVEDYSANYTDRSLVDKEYVDTAVGGATPSLSEVLATDNYSGSNDIEIEDGQKIFSDETYLSYNLTHNIDFGGALAGGLRLHSINNTTSKEAYIDVIGVAGNVAINADTAIDLNAGIAITITGGVGFQGAEYASDYSANYTDRSLVDKEYVDNGSLPLSGSLTVTVAPTQSTTNFAGYKVIGKSIANNKELDFLHYIPKRSSLSVPLGILPGSFVLATVPLNDSSSDFFEFRYNARKTTTPYGREVGTITAFYDVLTATVVFSRTGPVAIGDVSGLDFNVILTGATLQLTAELTGSSDWEFYAHTTTYASGFVE